MCTIAFIPHGKMLKSCGMILSFLFFCGCLHVAIACSERAVEKAIFDDYINRVRPVKNQSTITQVNINTQISILSIKEQEEAIELLTWTRLSWMDEYLQWNPIDSEGCEFIITLASGIWIPDYMITNLLEVKDIGMDNKLFARIESNGRVKLTIPSHVVVGCPMDIKDFPFDTQTCWLNVTSWAYPGSSIAFRKYMNGIRDRLLLNNSEFETISFTGEEVLVGENDVDFFELHYSLVLKRRPEYYIFVLLIPSFLLTTLCIIGIFAPNSSEGERNEKMTLGLTTLLSMAVILNITADQMPKSSAGLPLLGKLLLTFTRTFSKIWKIFLRYFILYEIGVCALSTIFSTILIWIHERANRKNWEPPTIIRWIASIPSPSGCLRWITIFDKEIRASKGFDKTSVSKVCPIPNDPNFTMTQKNPAKKSNTEGNEIFISLQQLILKVDQYLKDCDQDEERKVVWASALQHIDFFLLVVFFIGNCTLTAITLF